MKAQIEGGTKRSLLTPQSRWQPGRWLASLLVTLVFSSLAVCTASAGSSKIVPTLSLTLQDGMLAARIKATLLRQVMEEIGKLSGARVLWLNQPGGEEQVSVDFPALPIAEALERILGE